MSLDTQPSSLGVTWRSIAPGWSRSALSVLLASLSLACAIGLIATSAWLISRASQQPPILYLTVAVVAVRAFGIGRGAFRYLERLVSHSAALRGLTNLRVELVAVVARVSPGGVRWLRPGDAVRRLVDDVDAVAEYGLRTLYPSWTAAIVGLATVGLVAWLVPVAGVMLLAMMLVAGVGAPVLSHAVTRRAAATEVSLIADLAAETSWILRSAESIVAAGRVDDVMSGVGGIDDRLVASESRKAAGLGLAAGLAMLAQGAALVGVILVSVPAVTSGALNGVNLAVVVLVPLVAFEILAPLPTAVISRARAQRSATRINEIVTAPDPVVAVRDAVVCADPISGDLEVANLSATWPGAKEPAFAGVSFQVPVGGELVITGPSGAGKSTLAAVLVKFLDATGSVSIGGMKYGQLSGETVRRNVILSEQAPHIFDNTIAANVRFAAPDADDEQVFAALRQAELADWVESLPAGIFTQLGEQGAQVSGGQRQRIALARALLTDAPIVLFDEPTEHLDPGTAAALVASIRTALAGRTLVIFTHDEAVIESAPHVTAI